MLYKIITSNKSWFVITMIFSSWTIAAIQLKITPLIPSPWSENFASNLNTTMLNLSYSITAAFIFYLFTIYFPKKRNHKVLYPVICWKINDVYQCFYYIYLEFGRTQGYDRAGSGGRIKEAIFNDDIGRELLLSADWNAIISGCQGLPRSDRTHVQNMYYLYQRMIDIFDLIILYDAHLTAEQLKLIEEIRNSSFFQTIESCINTLRQNISCKICNNGWIDEFLKTKNKMLKLKEIQDSKKFGINSLVSSWLRRCRST